MQDQSIKFPFEDFHKQPTMNERMEAKIEQGD